LEILRGSPASLDAVSDLIRPVVGAAAVEAVQAEKRL
jgi:hypothetical protein